MATFAPSAPSEADFQIVGIDGEFISNYRRKKIYGVGDDYSVRTQKYGDDDFDPALLIRFYPARNTQELLMAVELCR